MPAPPSPPAAVTMPSVMVTVPPPMPAAFSPPVAVTLPPVMVTLLPLPPMPAAPSRLLPMVSISSMNTMQGAFWAA